MRTSSTILAVAALAAVASAVPKPEAYPQPIAAPHAAYPVNWCQVPGAPCQKKRAIEAGHFPGSWSDACDFEGTPCLKASHDDNTNYTVGDSVGACGMPGEPCDMMKRAAFAINDILERHIAAGVPSCAYGTFCDHKTRDLAQIADSAINGYDAVIKREAEAEAAASAHAKNYPVNWCQVPGAPCMAKLDQRDEADLPTHLIKYCDGGDKLCARRATADPEHVRNVKRCSNCKPHHCTPAQLQICHDLGEINNPLANLPTNAGFPSTTSTPLPKKTTTHTPPPPPKTTAKTKSTKSTKTTLNPTHRTYSDITVLPPPTLTKAYKPHNTHDKEPFNINWCQVPGFQCTKKRSEEVDWHVLEHPAGVKEALWDVKHAIDAIKRDAVALRATADPMEKMANCEEGRCSPVTHAHIVAQSENPAEADKAEHFAWGPYGASANTVPYFHAIERRVDEAIDSFDEVE